MLPSTRFRSRGSIIFISLNFKNFQIIARNPKKVIKAKKKDWFDTGEFLVRRCTGQETLLIENVLKLKFRYPVLPNGPFPFFQILIGREYIWTRPPDINLIKLFNKI